MENIRNWDDAVAWWRMAPDDHKIAVVVVFALSGLFAALIANGKGRNPILWFIVGVILPIVGVVIAAAMPSLRRRAEPAPTVVVHQPAYVPPPAASAGSGSITDEIQDAKRMLDEGTITRAEFDKIKAKLLGQ